jgi:hypothetical protein
MLVIPAQAGIHAAFAAVQETALDSGLRRNDDETMLPHVRSFAA